MNSLGQPQATSGRPLTALRQRFSSLGDLGTALGTALRQFSTLGRPRPRGRRYGNFPAWDGLGDGITAIFELGTALGTALRRFSSLGRPQIAAFAAGAFAAGAFAAFAAGVFAAFAAGVFAVFAAGVFAAVVMWVGGRP